MSVAATAACRILCVDDNDLDFERVQRLAPKLDIPVRLARAVDGAEALERLAACEPAADVADVAHGGEPLPDLVLLDLNMPRLDGHECLAEIRRRPHWDRLRVVIVSTSMRVHDREGTRAGAVDYLVKPLSLEALRALVTGVTCPDDAPGERG